MLCFEVVIHLFWVPPGIEQSKINCFSGCNYLNIAGVFTALSLDPTSRLRPPGPIQGTMVPDALGKRIAF